MERQTSGVVDIILYPSQVLKTETFCKNVHCAKKVEDSWIQNDESEISIHTLYIMSFGSRSSFGSESFPDTTDGKKSHSCSLIW